MRLSKIHKIIVLGFGILVLGRVANLQADVERLWLPDQLCDSNDGVFFDSDDNSDDAPFYQRVVRANGGEDENYTQEVRDLYYNLASLLPYLRDDNYATREAASSTLENQVRGRFWVAASALDQLCVYETNPEARARIGNVLDSLRTNGPNY